MKCLICEVGNLVPTRSSEVIRYKNRSLPIHGYLSSNCDACGACLVMAEQVKANQCLIADVQRRADGLLVSAEIAAIRVAMGLNRSQASKVFGGGPNAFSKYERGEIHPSEAVNKLLLLARDLPQVRSALLANASQGQASKSPVGSINTEAA